MLSMYDCAKGHLNTVVVVFVVVVFVVAADAMDGLFTSWKYLRALGDYFYQ